MLPERTATTLSKTSNDNPTASAASCAIQFLREEKPGEGSKGEQGRPGDPMIRRENLNQMIRAASAISKQLGEQVEKLARSEQASPDDLQRLKNELRRHLDEDSAELVYTTLLYSLGLARKAR